MSKRRLNRALRCREIAGVPALSASPAYLINGNAIDVPLEEYFARNEDLFTAVERARIRELQPGQSFYGGPQDRAWKVERVR